MHLYFIQRGQVRLYQQGPDGASRLLEILGAVSGSDRRR